MGLARSAMTVLTAGVTLAVGIALGNGPLQGDEPPNPHTQLKQTNDTLSAEVTDLRATRAFDRAVLSGSASEALAGQLKSRGVTLLVLPGVASATVQAVRTHVKEAGGTTALTADLTKRLIEPGQKAYVGSVAKNALRGLDGLRKKAGDSPYNQIGAALARAYTGNKNSLDVDKTARRIDGQLQGSKLVRIDKPVQRRGSLVLVLAPGTTGTDDVTQATYDIETSLLKALAAASDGVVIAAPRAASSKGGLFWRWRQDSTKVPVSTVNTLDSPAGKITAMYALAAAASGDRGAYGIVTGDIALPPGLRHTTK